MRAGLLLSCLAFSLFSKAQGQNQSKLSRPKLIVGIAIDQMRWDYLYRFYDRFGAGGFKRIMSGGFRCEQTFINYLPTYTAPGHACIWTGSVPAIHGIAGNTWIDNRTGRGQYCVDDTGCFSVGGSAAAGKMSPRNLLTTTVGDELKLATNGRSRVFGISLKDRASILPAGHSANAAFWYDDSTGAFITSSFYAEKLPDWLTSFNARRMPDSLLRVGWTLLQDSAQYRHSTADDNRYEGRLPGERKPVFPHALLFAENSAGFARRYDVLRYTPAGNTLTISLAKSLIAGELLGKSGDADLLAINLASTDYAGHFFGPNALEMEDLYLRLDAELANFLQFLDKNVGAGNYLLFITADHGSAHNPLFLQDRKIPAGFISERAIAKRLKEFVEKEFGSSHRETVLGVDNYQVYLNSKTLRIGSAERDEIKAAIRQLLEPEEGIEAVYDLEQGGQYAPEPLREMMTNGHHPRRSGALQIITSPGWYAGYGKTGTTHGTWNPYDTHIPLLWYGWGISPGSSQQRVNMTDIAPTLSALLLIQPPSGSVGRVIQEIFQTKNAARK